MIQVIFHLNAREELEFGINYYDSQVQGLGFDFLEEVTKFLDNRKYFKKNSILLQ